MINLSQPQLSSWAVWRLVHASKQSCVPQQSSGHQGGRAHPGLLGHLDTPGLQITWGCPTSCWRMFSPYPPFSSLALDVLPSFLPFLTCLWISTFLQLWSTLRLVGFSVSHPQTHTMKTPENLLSRIPWKMLAVAAILLNSVTANSVGCLPLMRAQLTSASPYGKVLILLYCLDLIWGKKQFN